MHGKQGEELSSLLLPGFCSHREGFCWWNTKLRQPLDLCTAWRVDLLGSKLPWNAAQGLVWVPFLPALLSAEGQQCSHRLCIPSLRMKTCGMLLVVLTSVSWCLGQDSASFPWHHCPAAFCIHEAQGEQAAHHRLLRCA